MIKNSLGLIAILLLSFLLYSFTISTKWNISPGYSIAFSNNDVAGIFKKFSGQVLFNPSDLKSSKFDVNIDVNSINTGNGLQNKHAKEVNWFDATKYPAIKFKSTSITKSASGYTVDGNLEMKGKTKIQKIPFTFVQTGNSGTFEGSFSIKLSDYGIGKAGEVENTIKLTIKVPVKK